MASELDRSTRIAAGVGVLVAVLMIAQQLAGKALRDAFFLSQFGPESLPTVMVVSSILSVAAVLGASQIFRRVAPAVLVPIVFWVSAAWFVVEWFLCAGAPRIAAISLYIHTTSFGAVVVSGFWSVVNERFDPHTAKRVIGRIAGGATAGGVLGGLAAWQGAATLTIASMIFVLAVSSVVCGIGLWQLGKNVEAPEQEAETKPPSLIKIMEETPYLWHLGLLVATSALGAAAFDYVFKARAAAAYDTSEDLVSFFALFYLGLGVATFIFQNLFAGRALRWLGLTITVATMPGAVVLLGLNALLFGGLASALALRGGAAIIESSLYRSGYELLYTPLTPAKKRATKTLIDVGTDKLGAAAGSAIALVVVALFPTSSETLLLSVAVGCGGIALVVTRYLHRGYVNSLAESLRTGSVSRDSINIADATTQRALQTSTGGVSHIDRELVLAGLEAEASGMAVSAIRPAPKQRRKARGQIAALDVDLNPREIDAQLRAVAALRSKDPARVRSVLHMKHPLPRELVVHLFPLLEDETLRPELMDVLRRVLPLHQGLVADILLSEQAAPTVRSLLPELLETLVTQTTADTLVRALATESFALRFCVALSLRRVVNRNPEINLDSNTIKEAVERILFEIRVAFPATTWAEEPKIGPRVVYAFVLLSTILPAEPMQLALMALGGANKARRGTGREYLENTLPKQMSDDLIRLVEIPKLANRASQPANSVVNELAEAANEQWANLDALRARFA